MKYLKLTLIAVVLFAAGTALYPRLPLHYQHELSDWYARLGTPSYSESPDYYSAREQADIIRENQARGHRLKCYGNLGQAERINTQDDYLCSANIGSAYDNIPARLVTFFFAKKKLNHVRIEFAGDSFDSLQDYLSRKLASYPRLDQRPHANFGTDPFGKPLMVWRVRDGLLITAAQDTPNQKPVLLWSSINSFRKGQ